MFRLKRQQTTLVFLTRFPQKLITRQLKTQNSPIISPSSVSPILWRERGGANFTHYMKKILTLTLVLLAGSSFNSISAAKKKDKKENVKQAATVVLNSKSDSLSYAAGKTATDGLTEYLKRMGVEAEHMPQFTKGFEEAVRNAKDPGFSAYMTGLQIAAMAEQRILPTAKADFADTKDSINSEVFYKGFISSLKKDNTHFTDSSASVFFNQYRQQAVNEKNLRYQENNKQWLADNAKQAGVITLPSGLQYKVISNGNGAKPQSTDEVVVKYEGKMIDGTVFDSSYRRNPQTSSFRCDQVIKGWTEALTLMPVGSKWELYIPQELAYGNRQAGQIKPFSTLIFTVELVDIKKPEVPQEEAKAPVAKAKTAVKKVVKKKK